MPSKKQASSEAYQYMSAPDMYRMAAQSKQLGALNPRARRFYDTKSRSMFRAGVARAKEARSTFNASMEAYKQSIRETVRRKGAIQRIQQELNKLRDAQDAIRDMLVSVKFQGDVISKAIDKKRYMLAESFGANVSNRSNRASVTKDREYRNLQQSISQQARVLQTQQELERRQRLVLRGINKGESMLKSLREKTYRSIETQAISKALLEQAKNLGLPLNRTTLRGLIVAEIDTALSSST